MSEIIKYPFGDHELDEIMAQYDEEEPTPMTPEDGLRMLDRLAVKIGPPGPAHKAPLFRWTLLGMICAIIAAVGIVAGVAVALLPSSATTKGNDGVLLQGRGNSEDSGEWFFPSMGAPKPTSSRRAPGDGR